MANNNAKGFGVILFHVNNFRRTKLDKFTDEELMAEYEKNRDKQEYGEYIVDYIPSLKMFYDSLNCDLIDTENWFFYVIPSNDAVATKTLIDKFDEVKDKIPITTMGRGDQTLLGDVVDWLRDFYGSPKDFHLAYLLIGHYQNKLEVEGRFHGFHK